MIVGRTLAERFGWKVGDNVTLRMSKGGVITGAVTDAAGEPLVGLSVRVVKVRDLEGSNAPPASM